MPISHIHMREGKSEEYRQSIFDSFYEALRAVLPIPEDDQFMTITEHSSVNFRYGNAFGVERTDDVIYIRLTIFDGRTVEVKQQLRPRSSRRSVWRQACVQRISSLT